MGNRKQPFGYKMALGKIVIQESEAKLVQEIFLRYIAGESLNELTESLRQQDIPYDEGRLWNKNMVARILADARYTGEKEYPKLIDKEQLIAANEKRSNKPQLPKKTEAQKVLRRLRGTPPSEQVEQSVTDLLNGLANYPDRIRSHVLHLMRGQVFELEGYHFFTMGGAKSHDTEDGILEPGAPDFERKLLMLQRKPRARYRINHVSWWAQEMPSEEEYAEARKNLAKVDWAVDYVITHCAPTSIALMENRHNEADPLTDFLQEVKERAHYHYWLFGHYHDNRAIDEKHILLWEQIVQVI